MASIFARLKPYRACVGCSRPSCKKSRRPTIKSWWTCHSTTGIMA
jgi:hypothetical protein